MYLKELLKDREVDFVIDYLGPLTALEKKGGGTYDAHEVKLHTTSNGEVYDARFFDALGKTVKQGDMVQGKLNNAGYPDFRKVESGETRNNSADVKVEREMATENEIGDNEEEAKWHKIGVSKIIHNYMRDFIAKDLTIKEAGEKAMDAYYRQEKTLDAIINAEVPDNSSLPF